MSFEKHFKAENLAVLDVCKPPWSSQIVMGYTDQAMEELAYSVRETALRLSFHSI